MHGMSVDRSVTMAKRENSGLWLGYFLIACLVVYPLVSIMVLVWMAGL